MSDTQQQQGDYDDVAHERDDLIAELIAIKVKHYELIAAAKEAYNHLRFSPLDHVLKRQAIESLKSALAKIEAAP